MSNRAARTVSPALKVLVIAVSQPPVPVADSKNTSPGTITTQAALQADLTVIRERGFALDDEERTEGMRCIAAPVFNALSEPVAGISVSGPVFRMPQEQVAQLGALVAQSALDVTRAIGGQAPA